MICNIIMLDVVVRVIWSYWYYPQYTILFIVIVVVVVIIVVVKVYNYIELEIKLKLKNFFTKKHHWPSLMSLFSNI